MFSRLGQSKIQIIGGKSFVLPKKLLQNSGVDASQIQRIGIAYQMHGLVVVDQSGECLRNSIIWCDSRAVSIGEKAYQDLGAKKCMDHLLNSPANFTASKLKWVKENEPHIYEKIHKYMLPGDYIAYKFSGEMTTTINGLSEGRFGISSPKRLPNGFSIITISILR